MSHREHSSRGSTSLGFGWKGARGAEGEGTGGMSSFPGSSTTSLSRCGSSAGAVPTAGQSKSAGLQAAGGASSCPSRCSRHSSPLSSSWPPIRPPTARRIRSWTPSTAALRRRDRRSTRYLPFSFRSHQRSCQQKRHEQGGGGRPAPRDRRSPLGIARLVPDLDRPLDRAPLARLLPPRSKVTPTRLCSASWARPPRSSTTRAISPASRSSGLTSPSASSRPSTKLLMIALTKAYGLSREPFAQGIPIKQLYPPSPPVYAAPPRQSCLSVAVDDRIGRE